MLTYWVLFAYLFTYVFTHFFNANWVQIRAPRTLYVQQPQQDNSSSSNDNSNDSKIQYPRIAVPVDAFVLRRGRHQLQTFLPPQPPQQQAQPSPSDVVVVAHTFCRVCGVHLVQAVDPAAKELYVNALCLVGTKSGAPKVVAAHRSSYKQQQDQQQPIQSSQCVDLNSATNKHATSSSRNNNISSSIGASPPSLNNDCSSDSDPEMVILSAEQDLWDDRCDPEFTLTAAEDSRSTSTSSASYCCDDGKTTSQQQPRQHRARAPETTGTAVDTTGTDEPTMRDEPTMAAVDLNTSFGSSSTSSTTDAQQEQLRKFLGKHVAHQ